MIGYNHLGRNGRLGNQMFQYAALRGIADIHNYEFTIPDSNFEDEWNTHQLFETFKLPNLKSRGFVEDRYLQESEYNYNKELVDNCPDNISLFGYFQTEKYFNHISDSIREDFTFHEEIFNSCNEVMEDFDSPISLHVRRTDYVEKSQDHPPCSMEYYIEALSHFGDERQVIIFSDDVNWCKEQELFSSDRFMISETNDNRYDLCLMTLCSDYIIANSSFSWWGAWLSHNKDPKVIAPTRWFGSTGYTASHNTEDIIPERWIKI